MIRPAVDLFAGFGGFSTGAIMTGQVNVVLAANHWDQAIEWSSRNHPSTRHLHVDVSELDWTELPDLTDGLLLAGPSCPAWSSCGAPARRGTGGNGKAPQMAYVHKQQRTNPSAVAAAIDASRPAAAIVENVGEMARWDAFEGWLGYVESMGYVARVHTLNARDFGTPQDRERLIVTFGRGRAIDLVAPSVEPPSIRSCLDRDGHRWAPIDSKPERTRRLIRSRQEASGLAEGLLNNVGDGVRMRDLDRDLFPTLTTQAGTQLMHVEQDRVRILNPTEIARAQGFPEGYLLPSKRKLASRLVGNAVPVDLARGVVEQTVKQLEAA